jgi:D-sedoheptulose 7-phosphate isomerase
MNKGVSFKQNKKFKVICLNDNIPTMLAYGNDLSFDHIFVEQLKNFMLPDDIVMAISGSGSSVNVIKAVQYANKNKVTTVSLTGFDGGKLKKLTDCSVIIPSQDMQKIEDFHLILIHIIMRCFLEYLK